MAQVTYLQLSPEFGGQRFGPFRGVEIRLGSDPDFNDISLPADLGVAPQHLKVLQQGENTFIIAPVDRTTTVYIWRQNSNKPKQIVTPMAVTPGDSFSLVVPEGARFTIEVGTLQKEKDRMGDSMADKAMKRMPTSRGLLDEIKRRGFAAVFTTKLGNAGMNVWRFIVTGQIFSPVYIIAGLMMVSGWFMAGGVGCGAMSLNTSKNGFADALRTCEAEKDGLDPMDGGKQSVQSLTRNILEDDQWKPTLIDDRPLMIAYGAALVSKLGRTDGYKWVYINKQNKFAAFSRAINELPPSLRGTLSYLAAHPKSTGYREWAVIEDSEGNEVCARGPLKLTFRQAVRLGLENVQLDKVVSQSVANSADKNMKAAELMKTAEFEGYEPPLNLDGTQIAEAGGAEVQGGRECLHLEGPDDRDDVGKLAKAIREQLGATAKGLPGEGQPYWIGHRLAKLAAMDFQYQYGDLKFNAGNRGPISNLEAQNVVKKRTEFAASYVADVMSNAVAARCSARLDKEMQDSPPEHLGTLPELEKCLIIKGMVDYGLL